MALTINTHPGEVITNAPEFDVTTSLVEGASYQNLRIRATVYQGGESEAIAVLEQPKGLDDWDLSALLRSLTGKCNQAVGGSTALIGPGLSGELLTGWTNVAGLFETFTTSGRVITSAIDSNASGAVAGSNDMRAGSAGDVYVVGVASDYSDSSLADFVLKLVDALGGNVKAQNQYAGLTLDKLTANHIYFLLLTEAEAATFIILQSAAGSNGNIAGTFTVNSISDFKNNPGVYFSVKFEEVYENVSDVTTIGAESWSDTLLFMPVDVPVGEALSDYIMKDTWAKFLTRAEKTTASSSSYKTVGNYKVGIGQEYRILGISTSPYLRLKATTPALVPSETDISGAGWFIVIINENITPTFLASYAWYNVLLSSCSDGWAAVLYNYVSLNVWQELNCYPDIKALAFVGDLGEETILFKGFQKKTGMPDKSFYKNSNRVRRVLRAYKKIIHMLRTLVESEITRGLLNEMAYSEKDVWMYDSDETAGYKDVTVITDKTDIEDGDRLIESEIEIEYYE